MEELPLLLEAMLRSKQEITYKAEPKNFDVWLTGDEARKFGGDCEDIALDIRQQLIKGGVVDDDIHLVAGDLKSTGETHMVIEVNGRVLDFREEGTIEAAEYLKDYMSESYRVSKSGLTYKGHPFLKREDMPKWKRYLERFNANSTD